MRSTLRPSMHRLASLAMLGAVAAFGADAQNAQDFGAYRVRYSALPTSQLLPDVAKRYDILRSSARGFVNIAVQRIAAGDTSSPIRAAVDGHATSLGGASVTLKFREIAEDGATYYISEFPVSAPDTYRFAITVTPETDTAPFTLKFNQDFVAD